MERSYVELRRLMAASGMDDVPMLRGCDAPLANETDTPESEGVDFIIREALREDGRPLYITAQGALTDVAAALNRRPEIAERLTVVWIGGGPYPQGGGEFNLMQDVDAARAALASRAELWQLPVTVYSTVEVTMAELARKVRPAARLAAISTRRSKLITTTAMSRMNCAGERTGAWGTPRSSRPCWAAAGGAIITCSALPKLGTT